jgi:hypothetical protein
MARTLLVCALLAAVPAAAPAQQAPAATETVVRLTVRPMAAPKPVLKYVFLPEMKDMEPGNPVQGYLKCFSEQQNFWYNRTAVENRQKWLEMPLHQLPLDQVSEYGYLGTTGGPLVRAERAARLSSPDWQVLLQAKREGPNMLLPEIQQHREIGSALKVRFRAQIAQRDYDGAVITAQTMFALARHLGEHPALISNLVGLAVANLATGPLEEMAQQPDSPNLFWALTDLPNPIVSIQRGLEGERMFSGWQFVGLDGSAPMSEAELRKVVARIEQVQKYRVEARDATRADVRAWLKERAGDEKALAAARRRLAEAGLDQEKLKEFPPLQVVLLDEKRAHDVARDEVMKWMKVPYWQADDPLAATPSTHDDPLAAGLPQFSVRVRRAQTRIQQRLALLAHVEALRLYAADHDGKLPARLNDLALPLPVDPVTGKAFRYEVEGQTAVLHGTPPKGEEKNAPYNVRFVVTVQK